MKELKPYTDKIEPVVLTGLSKFMAFEETRNLMKSQSLKSLEQPKDVAMQPKRRIHIDGVQMLDTHYVNQEINEKFVAR